MRKATTGRPWTEADKAVLFDVYPEGGGRAVQALLPEREMSSIKNAAERYGVEYRGGKKGHKPEELMAVVVPRMDLTESLACLQLRKWKGPVNRESPMRWRVAA